MKNSSKSIIALFAGLAAGVALGILFAPEKGSETRDKLADSLKDLGDSLKEKAALELDNLTELKNKVVSTIKTKLKSDEDDLSDDLHAV
ncbi:MAG: YtxH domain-containing protein [Sphingobacteriales bacterium]|nr:MAG: YtxH domain-containing protein [Sphingobacteriales bacterium]